MSNKVTGREPLEFYLALRYRIALFPEEEGGYTVTVPDLPGCIAQGDDATEALVAIEEARRAWIEVAYEDGDEIPLPAEERKFSGRVLVRMPPMMHRNLVSAASAEGISLNQYICNSLSGSYSHWQVTRELVTLQREMRMMRDSYRQVPPVGQKAGWQASKGIIPFGKSAA